MPEKKPRGVRRLRISRPMIGHFLEMNGRVVVETNFPKDAECISAHYDDLAETLWVYMSSEEWEPGEEGALYPELQVTYRDVTPRPNWLTENLPPKTE